MEQKNYDHRFLVFTVSLCIANGRNYFYHWRWSSWSFNVLGTGRLFKLSWELWVRHRKIQDSAGKHRGLERFGSFSTVYSLGRLALTRVERLFWPPFFNFWTGTSPNHVQDATSALNGISKNCQQFVDHRMPLQSISNNFKSKKMLSVLPLI